MTISEKSIIDPEPPKPGIPVKKSTLAVIVGLLLAMAVISAMMMDSATTVQQPTAHVEAKPGDPLQDSGSKGAIDEESKKAKQAAEDEARKKAAAGASQQPRPENAAAQQTPVQPVVTAGLGPQSPLPPGVRRTGQEGALYDRSGAKASGTALPSSGGTGGGRGGDDFEIESQVRGAKSMAFDDTQPVSGVAQQAQAALGLPALSPAGSSSTQKALAGLSDLVAGGNAQAPSSSVQSSMDRMLANLKTAQSGSTARTQTGGTGNVAWVNEYSTGGGQRNAETIKPYPTTSPYTLHQGKIIPAVLGRQVNSDLPGEITAYVMSNVFDSMGQGALLIPMGSVLVGRYNSEIKVGQERVLFAFNRLIMPNGQSFDLPGAQGADLAGASGITGDVNNHFFKMFSTSFFTAWLADRVTPQTTTTSGTGTTTAVSPAGQVLVDVSKAILDRNKSIPPTITVDQGTRINVEVKKDMEFSGPYSWSKK